MKLYLRGKKKEIKFKLWIYYTNRYYREKFKGNFWIVTLSNFSTRNSYDKNRNASMNDIRKVRKEK